MERTSSLEIDLYGWTLIIYIFPAYDWSAFEVKTFPIHFLEIFFFF